MAWLVTGARGVRATLYPSAELTMKYKIDFDIPAQPDEETCGPTCLQALYRYYGDDISLGEVTDEIDLTDSVGTQAVILACHALRRGYSATIYTYNLQLFDPSWFEAGLPSPRLDLRQRLLAQLEAKGGRKLEVATRAYLEFLERKGTVAYRELGAELILHYLKFGYPILTGLSATYLYGCARDYRDQHDDVRGRPAGHFVVVCGYDATTGRALIADPLQDDPRGGGQYHHVGVERLIGAIFLGAQSYDANLLVIEPRADGPHVIDR